MIFREHDPELSALHLCEVRMGAGHDVVNAPGHAKCELVDQGRAEGIGEGDDCCTRGILMRAGKQGAVAALGRQAISRVLIL